MTTRINNPDTDADRALRAALDNHARGFVMLAGAGSGKTTSLIKGLEHLARTQTRELKRRGQKIACITYTEVASKEIWGDVRNAPLFHVSTIHSFLWTVVKPFQSELKSWIEDRLRTKIVEAQERINNSRTQQRIRETLSIDIERYQAQIRDVSTITRIKYGTGSDYGQGILGHDDILKIGTYLMSERPLLRRLVAKQFPYIFVDESQDTQEAIVTSLKAVALSAENGFCLGFFGDPMQKIYTTGIGTVSLEQGWIDIQKPENFRCPTSVLRVLNKIRAGGDGLEQTRGRARERDGILEPVVGTARVFILPSHGDRQDLLRRVRNWLANANQDPLWENDTNDGDVRMLVLVHRMAAMQLGFADLYGALNDNGSGNLKEGLLDGSAWVLRPFMAFVLPLVTAVRVGDDFEVMQILRRHCPLLSPERLAGQNVLEVLRGLRENIGSLASMIHAPSDHSTRDVLLFIRDHEIGGLDERFMPFLNNPAYEGGDGAETAEVLSVKAFLECNSVQLWGYRSYVENQSPFATQHGIKGTEFQRVLVVLDDEEGNYNLYSYGKYFGITPLSARDQQNRDQGEESVIERTRRLLYVCCSRTLQDLAVVFIVPDPNAARLAVLAKELFPSGDVHVIE